MELISLLERMKMEHLLAQLDGVCEHAAKGDLDYKGFLTQALEAESRGRRGGGPLGALPHPRGPDAAPDERAVVKRFEESFTGSLTSFLVSPRLAADKDSLETASQMTRRRLAWAREASGGTRVSPRQLIVQTSFWSPQRPELNLQEAEVLWLLGLNVVNRWPEVREKYAFVDPGGHHWVTSHPVVEAGLYDAPAGTALVLANFTYRPIEALTVRVPLAKPVQVVRSVEYGPLRFTEEQASPALREQGYGSVAVFTTRLGLNDIILLE
ncbi:MAG TPA: hypothetical protein VGK54_09935 [Chloroflexota bacterium]|jgi:hypothetical protein